MIILLDTTYAPTPTVALIYSAEPGIDETIIGCDLNSVLHKAVVITKDNHS